jgi:hypothetical protein
VAACKFLLRFVSVGHGPISATSVELSKPFPDVLIGDDFGRVLIRLAAGGEAVGVVSAAGYEPAGFSIPCVRENKTLERVMVLGSAGR